MSWRELKETMRRTVHDTFYYDAKYVKETGEVSQVRVRVLRNDQMVGDFDGTGYAAMAAAPPTLVFMMDEMCFTPERGDTVVLDTGVTYFIENPLIPDYPTISCEASEVEG